MIKNLLTILKLETTFVFMSNALLPASESSAFNVGDKVQHLMHPYFEFEVVAVAGEYLKVTSGRIVTFATHCQLKAVR